MKRRCLAYVSIRRTRMNPFLNAVSNRGAGVTVRRQCIGSAKRGSDFCGLHSHWHTFLHSESKER